MNPEKKIVLYKMKYVFRHAERTNEMCFKKTPQTVICIQVKKQSCRYTKSLNQTTNLSNAGFIKEKTAKEINNDCTIAQLIMVSPFHCE